MLIFIVRYERSRCIRSHPFFSICLTPLSFSFYLWCFGFGLIQVPLFTAFFSTFPLTLAFGQETLLVKASPPALLYGAGLPLTLPVARLVTFVYLFNQLFFSLWVSVFVSPFNIRYTHSTAFLVLPLSVFGFINNHLLSEDSCMAVIFPLYFKTFDGLVC